MNNFTYTSATDTSSALKLLSESPDRNAARFLAGGTNLVDLMREGIEQPQSLVDITRLPLAEVQELPDGGVRIGAMVRNSHLAAHAVDSREISAALAGDSHGRLCSAPQHGDHRRQPDATHSLLLLLRQRRSVQQTRPRQRLRCDRGI